MEYLSDFLNRYISWTPVQRSMYQEGLRKLLNEVGPMPGDTFVEGFMRVSALGEGLVALLKRVEEAGE